MNGTVTYFLAVFYGFALILYSRFILHNQTDNIHRIKKTNDNVIIFNLYQCSVVNQDQFITYLLSDAMKRASNVLWCSRIHRQAAVPIVLHINKQCVYCMYCTQNLPFLIYVFPSSMQKMKQSAPTCARKVSQSLRKLGKVIFQARPIHFIQGRRKFCQKSPWTNCRVLTRTAEIQMIKTDCSISVRLQITFTNSPGFKE